jgi:uncharacterized protein YjlB
MIMDTKQYFFQDDGTIPNSVFPLIVYRAVFPDTGAIADSMEEEFAGNNWKNSWRNGVYAYHHYHSNTHEVLGVYKGSATLQFGGEKGEKMNVRQGDVVVLPAGTGHKKIEASDDFGVIGAYPGGMHYDLMKGEDGERPGADENIAKVPFPDNDPVTGSKSGIIDFWK